MKTLALFLVLILSSSAYAQQHVTVLAEQDATLYENDTGSLGNGTGDHNFVGRTGSNGGNALRRTVIKFPDVGVEIPNSAAIDSVFFTFFVNKVGNARLPKTITLNTVTTPWTFGESDPSGNEGQGTQALENDATWIHSSFPDDTWDSPGGDFIVDTLAVGEITGTGSYTFKGSEAFIDLVQGWKDSTISNYGIMILGEENLSQSTSIRFASVENPEISTIPLLRIYFTDLSSGTVTSNESTVSAPATFSLGSNYPNPFNPQTVIPYSLTNSGDVRLAIYNVIGQEVEVLVNAFNIAGDYEVVFDASALPTGIYFYQLQTSEGVQTKRLTLLK